MFDFLFPQITGDDDDLEPELEGEESDETEPEGEEPEEPESESEEPEPRISRAQKDIINARQRAQDAEEQLARVREQLEAARRQPVANEAQQLWEQEEAVLRNPQAEEWQKYAVQSARDARLARQSSQAALAQAQDYADKAQFDQFRASNPKLFAEYSPKVEAELAKLRAAGNNAPRSELLALLIGRDMRDGKIKGSTNNSGGARRAPIAQADTSPRPARLSESEKRMKRLENVRI